jgi:diguanylate cyclase (GGDEF)-like protein
MTDDVMAATRALEDARSAHWEDPSGATAVATAAGDTARRAGADALLCRGLALQGSIALNRGDLHAALALATEAEPWSGEDVVACAELGALKSQLTFFSGTYSLALAHAEEASALADAHGDAHLRLYVRRAACMVFGTVGVPGWAEWLHETLALSIAAGDDWQEAISRNDLACWHQREERLADAEAELARGLEAAARLRPGDFALGVLHSTRADIRLLASRPEEALADANRSLAHQFAQLTPNPYILGVTVRAQVQALAALGRLDDAQLSGDGALDRLGTDVPHARSLVLATLADALRDAGRLEDAYDALSRSAALEREGLHDLSELRINLERARLETDAARSTAAALAAKNAELEALVHQLNEAHVALEQRTGELETLQDQFREQADRDWLTGLHNRRYLARQLDLVTGAEEQDFSLAVVDLDHFKAINDTYGHDVGDQVLVRVAGLLLDVVRRSDVVARTGGEEFVLLMPAADTDAAMHCCERALAAIRGAVWEDVAPGLTVTASAGIARSGEALGLDRIAALADRRLYDAKRQGRDRAVARTSPVDDPLQ